MDWKKKTVLFYLGCGMVLGVLAGILSIKNAEENNKEINLSVKDGAKICITALDSLKKIVIK